MLVRDRVLDLRRVKASDLRANPKNWRRHPQTQAVALRSVLEKVGYAGALLARETPEGLELIDGHLRQEISGSQEVPVLVLDVDDAEADLILATLDPLSAMAQTDEQALYDLLQDVIVPDDVLAQALEEMTGQAGPPAIMGDPDAIPEVPAEPSTKPGDLYLLGDHRLLCGDSTSRADVDRLMGGNRANLMLTDPPYGIGVEYGVHQDSEAELRKLVAAFFPLFSPLVDVSLITPGNGNQALYPTPTWTLAWVEQAGVGRSPWGFTCWQPVLAYGPDPYLAHGLGARPDIIMGKGEGASSFDHPVAKPAKLWEQILLRGSIETGDVVVDPFLGSGTTMIVAEANQRVCYGMELNPAYCDVIVARWEEFTGQSVEKAA